KKPTWQQKRFLPVMGRVSCLTEHQGQRSGLLLDFYQLLSLSPRRFPEVMSDEMIADSRSVTCFEIQGQE
ncbi:hypothetical protein NQZ68_039904, partial [Dissostichus eleginoides]